MNYIVTIIIIICIALINVLVARWVYHDAIKSGMSCWTWGISCLLVPEVVFIYLIVKKNRGTRLM